MSIDGLMLLSLVWMGYLYEANSNLHLFFLQALYERGQKLSELEEKTAQMMANAENFQQAANQIMQKYKDKKWYQFWVETNCRLHTGRSRISFTVMEDLHCDGRCEVDVASTQRWSDGSIYLCAIERRARNHHRGQHFTYHFSSASQFFVFKMQLLLKNWNEKSFRKDGCIICSLFQKDRLERCCE